MADHSKPTVLSTESGFVNELDSRFDDLAKMLDATATTPTNLPIDAVRRNGLDLQRWTGSTWVTVAKLNSTDVSAALTALGVSAFIRQLLDDADAAAARATLGVSGAVDNYCKIITDWNDATTNGWYMGSVAANAPTAGTWYMGTVICHNAIWTTQFVHAFSSDSVGPNASKRYWRAQDGGVWTDWVSDDIPYTTAFARTLLDDADAAAARATLGLSAFTTKAHGNIGMVGTTVSFSGGNIASVTIPSAGALQINFSTAISGIYTVSLTTREFTSKARVIFSDSAGITLEVSSIGDMGLSFTVVS